MTKKEKARILLVEDEPNVTELIIMALERHGYTVTLVEDGSEVIPLLKRERVDLLILDIMIPKVNGFDLCRKIKSDPLLKALPVIILSALAQRGEIERGIRMGADIYMTKPFQNKQLLDAIAKLLQHKGV